MSYFLFGKINTYKKYEYMYFSLGGDAMTQWFTMKVIIQGFFYNINIWHEITGADFKRI